MEMYKPLYDDPQQPVGLRNGWEQLAEELDMTGKVSFLFVLLIVDFFFISPLH